MLLLKNISMRIYECILRVIPDLVIPFIQWLNYSKGLLVSSTFMYPTSPISSLHLALNDDKLMAI